MKPNYINLALRAAVQDAQCPVAVERGFGQQPEQRGFAQMVRTGAGDQDAAGPEQAQGAQVDLFICACRGFQVAFGFREGGWVQHHH
jgi:hypothetical protein